MLSFLLHLVAMPADDSPALDIPALADVPAVNGNRAAANSFVAAAGVPPLLLPLLLPKPLSVDFSLALLLLMYLHFLTSLMMMLCS